MRKHKGRTAAGLLAAGLALFLTGCSQAAGTPAEEMPAVEVSVPEAGKELEKLQEIFEDARSMEGTAVLQVRQMFFEMRTDSEFLVDRVSGVSQVQTETGASMFGSRTETGTGKYYTAAGDTPAVYAYDEDSRNWYCHAGTETVHPILEFAYNPAGLLAQAAEIDVQDHGSMRTVSALVCAADIPSLRNSLQYAIDSASDTIGGNPAAETTYLYLALSYSESYIPSEFTMTLTASGDADTDADALVSVIDEMQFTVTYLQVGLPKTVTVPEQIVENALPVPVAGSNTETVS